MSKRLDRRLVAVMFTDMVGYTALMQADERLGLEKRGRLRRRSRFEAVSVLKLLAPAVLMHRSLPKP